MSHIEQALRHAGVDGAVRTGRDADPHRLDRFPSTKEHTLRKPEPVGAEAPSVIRSFDSFDATLVVHEPLPRVCTEQFRTLAGVLHQKQHESGLKTLMITSAHPNEGKTFTTANLGLVLSESYRRRVLLVDADLRRPCLHEVFNVPNDDGLADSLKQPALRPARIVQLSDWLSVLSAGTPDPDPMPSLTSSRMKTIVHDAASKFDWVILDTPPVSLLPDARLVGDMVEGAVLVIGAGNTPYRMVNRAVETIGRNKIIGVVLNRAEENTLPEASYDRYYGSKSSEAGSKRGFLRP